MTTRVAIFIDGKNFYEGIRSTSANNSKFDFNDLSKFIVKSVSGTTLTGLHYFTGVDKSSEENNLEKFLSFLSNNDGCFVNKFERKYKKTRCNNCGNEHSFVDSKIVDTSIVATMITQAAIDAFDIAVLCSGDSDHIPALTSLKDLGKPAWVASFGNYGLSNKVKEQAYGIVNLFDFDQIEEIEKDYDVISALKDAEEYFGEERYVGFNLFCKVWRTDYLPINSEVRNKLIQESIDSGDIEVYETEDGCKAIRSLV